MEEKPQFNRAKKTRIEKKLKDLNSYHKGKLRSSLKMTQDIREIVEEVTDKNVDIYKLAEEAQFLDVINRTDLNKYLNLCLNGSTETLIKLQTLNNAFLDKIISKKSIISTKDCAKIFIKLKELENNQIKLITELSKSQQFTLEEIEREIIIIFRSIPRELQKYLYKTILEFVKQCPRIQKAMLKTKLKQEQKEKAESLLRKEVEERR